ncbi:unnamed protein product [Phytomonas sp. EM1]|nr:unnamed protein product [Phytomonas sp. EM1]|eukprot:CCW60594.1 unnamed protein product [Phytomonas sp. isolate EM1]
MMLRSPPLGGLISDTAGLSFCSISVEASGRERIGETVSANECSSIDHDARFRDDEDGMFLAYDLSAIHDEVCYLRRQMTELTQNLKRSRADQELLVQQMKGMQEDMLVNLHCLKLTPLKDVQNNILILQNQLEALQALVLNSQYVKDSRNGSSTQVTADLPPLRVASSENDTARIRLNLKLDLDRHFLAGATNPPSSASPPSEVFIFILMARPTDSVGSVKEQLLKRLSANKILPENSPISASNTFLFFDEKVLFDTDLLGQDLQMKLAPEGEYTLTLRRKT